MKGVICDGAGGPEVLKLADVGEPVLKPGEVLIGVKATALNGADVMQRMGNYPPPPGASELLGLEVSGEILEVGEGASKFKVGDKVMALLDGGGYAEKVAVPEGFVMPLPKGFSWEQGAAVPETWITAYLELIMLGQLQRGQAILIHAGASGVGAAAIQIAKDVGATVFVTASSSEKLQFCKELGADHLINYKEQDFSEIVKEHTTAKNLPSFCQCMTQGNDNCILSRLDGPLKTFTAEPVCFPLAVPGGNVKAPGVDVILDLVGASHFPKNIESLSIEGRLLLVGLPSGLKSEINLAQVLMKRLHIIGSTLRARPRQQKVEIVEKFSKFAISKLASGEFKPQVDISLPLAEAAQAHQRMADAKNKGKIILLV